MRSKLSCFLALSTVLLCPAAHAQTAHAQTAHAQTAPAPLPAAAGTLVQQPTLLSPADIARLFPPTVFYRGQTATVQLRNAAGAHLPPDTFVLAGLVDTSGYSTAIKAAYQLYLISEVPLSIGDRTLSAGAYGAGILGDGSFVVMDLGGHQLLSSHAEADPTMRRPRPLQLLLEPNGDLRLCLGRTCALITPQR